MRTLSGVIPPLVTPLSAHDKLDVEAVDRVVDHVIDGGVSGVFALGTTGEGPSLNYQIRYEMVERTCSVAEGRVPVLVCVTDSSLSESLYLVEHAKSCVADAVVAAAPFYFPVSQEAVIDWFRRLADASTLPVLLYNMPGCVRVHLEVDTVVTLSEHPNIVGIKDSSGDLGYFQSLCDTFTNNDEFVVFMGPEELLAEAVAAGGDGGVCGGANLLPAVYSELFKAARSRNASEITRLKSIVDAVFDTVYRDPAGQMNLIPALKRSLELSGICSNAIAPPLQPISHDHERQIQQGLSKLLTSADSPLTLHI